MFKIGGIQKTTLLDYPSKIACIVFGVGCNFRCGYCHNPELFLLNQNTIDENTFFSFLESRKNKLDGVVITGGEPTIQKELYSFIKQIKSMGFLIKLDTNGTNPDIIEKLLSENLIDYIAMDIKGPLYKYEEITNTKCDLEKIKKSIEIILNSNIEYEFRTTVLKNQLNKEDFVEISKLIQNCKKYYLQKFIPSKILDSKLLNEGSYSDEEFKEIINTMEIRMNSVHVR